MPAFETAELEQLIESLEIWDEERLRAAIDHARDPDKAAQFISRLQAELEADELEDFKAIALIVVGLRRLIDP